MTTVASRTSNPTVELVDSSPLLGDPAALLERAAVDDYLFFRGLLRRTACSTSAGRSWGSSPTMAG